MPTVLQKFVNETLTRKDILAWLKEQGQIKFLAEKQALTEKDLDHIAMCMHHIYQAYHDMVPKHGLGHFLTAVIKNDFMEACGTADKTNSLVLPLYATFLYNCTPGDYREKILGSKC